MVPGFDRTTATPGSTAPVESTTVPLIAPAAASCASAADGRVRHHSSTMVVRATVSPLMLESSIKRNAASEPLPAIVWCTVSPRPGGHNTQGGVVGERLLGRAELPE